MFVNQPSQKKPIFSARASLGGLGPSRTRSATHSASNCLCARALSAWGLQGAVRDQRLAVDLQGAALQEVGATERRLVVAPGPDVVAGCYRDGAHRHVQAGWAVLRQAHSRVDADVQDAKLVLAGAGGLI